MSATQEFNQCADRTSGSRGVSERQKGTRCDGCPSSAGWESRAPRLEWPGFTHPLARGTRRARTRRGPFAAYIESGLL